MLMAIDFRNHICNGILFVIMLKNDENHYLKLNKN